VEDFVGETFAVFPFEEGMNGGLARVSGHQREGRKTTKVGW
jgi:hypothetical protein